MSFIHFANRNIPSCDLADLIYDLETKIDELRPYKMSAIFSPENQTITHQVTLCLGFDQLSNPLKDKREFCKIKNSSVFHTIKKDSNSAKALAKLMHENCIQKVKNLLIQEVILKDPDFKKLKNLKIKILSQNSTLKPIYETTVKIDWDKPSSSFTQQLLDQEIINANKGWLEYEKSNSPLKKPISYINEDNLMIFSRGLALISIVFLIARGFLRNYYSNSRS